MNGRYASFDGSPCTIVGYGDPIPISRGVSGMCVTRFPMGSPRRARRPGTHVYPGPSPLVPPDSRNHVA